MLSLTVWRGGNIKLWEEKADLLTELITKLFVEQPLALPGSANITDTIKVLLNGEKF